MVGGSINFWHGSPISYLPSPACCLSSCSRASLAHRQMSRWENSRLLEQMVTLACYWSHLPWPSRHGPPWHVMYAGRRYSSSSSSLSKRLVPWVQVIFVLSYAILSPTSLAL